jgi:hypothetical protein
MLQNIYGYNDNIKYTKCHTSRSKIYVENLIILHFSSARGDLVHMSTATNAPSTFRILKFFKISKFYVLKNYGVKYIDRYI